LELDLDFGSIDLAPRIKSSSAAANPAAGRGKSHLEHEEATRGEVAGDASGGECDGEAGEEEDVGEASSREYIGEAGKRECAGDAGEEEECGRTSEAIAACPNGRKWKSG
jgi:hypothetical protein